LALEKSLMNNSDKTIPYRPTPAELANLRILRRRLNPYGPDCEDGKAAGGQNPWESDTEAVQQENRQEVKTAPK
jgi:hypothetical protein